MDFTQVFRIATTAMVRSDQPDLTARQMGVFLTVALTDGPHTVRGLAAKLSVSKPAITRALDRLGELDLVVRKTDPKDRRSVNLTITSNGETFLQALRNTFATAEIEAAGKETIEATTEASEPLAEAA